MSDTLRLSDIMGRSLVIQWHEAVALVGEVAERVLDKPGAHSVPELDDIELSADGQIAVAGGMSTDEPVRRLGQLLQAVLAQSEPPVQLRLVVSQATAPAPAFGSIREFQDAVGYFERPDRLSVLQGLYTRAVAAPEEPGQRLPRLDTIAPLVVPGAPKKPAPQPGERTNHRGLWLALAAALLVLAGTAGYAKFGSGARGSQLSAAAVKASDALGTAVVSGISSVTDRAGLGRLAPKDSSGAVSPAPAAPTQGAAAPMTRKAPAPRLPYQVFDLEPLPALDRTVKTAGPVASESPLIQAPTPTDEEFKADNTIYSAADPVTPPVGVRPQLPRQLPPNINKDQLARIEMVILPDGTVGSVKLLGHRDVKDSMLLSAVKAWEFQPATRAGRPVSYRKTVWIAFQ